MKLSLHISPCPNDTFAFDAIINKRLEHNFNLAVEYHDIEVLNEGVLRGEPDISKISYAIAILIVIGKCVLYFVGGQPFEIMDFMAYMLQSLMIAVTLVVVSVPEGLPMAVTLSLAYSMGRL